MNSVQIRRAGIADVECVAYLFDQYRQFYAQAPNIAHATQFIGERVVRRESVILLAEDERKAVGFCQMYPTFCSVAAAQIAVLYDLFVSQPARNTGVGRALMLAAQAYAKHNGFTRLDLSTAQTNMGAQALYESLGWQRDEVFYYYSLALND